MSAESRSWLELEYEPLTEVSNVNNFGTTDEAEFQEFWKNQTASTWSTSGEGSHWPSDSEEEETLKEEEEQTENENTEGSFFEDATRIPSSNNEHGETEVNEETRKNRLIHEYLLSLRNVSNLYKTNMLLHQKLLAAQDKVDNRASGNCKPEPISAHGSYGSDGPSSHNMAKNYSPEQAYRWQIIQYYSLQNDLLESSEDVKLIESKMKERLDSSIENYDSALKTLLRRTGCLQLGKSGKHAEIKCAKEIIEAVLRIKNRIASFHYHSIRSYIEYSPYSSYESMNPSGRRFKSIQESLKSISESLKIIGPIQQFENDALLYKHRIHAQRTQLTKAHSAIVNIIQACAHTREKVAFVDNLEAEQKLQLHNISKEIDIVQAKHSAVSDLYLRVTSSDTFSHLKRSLKMQEEIGQLKSQRKKFYLQKSYMERVLRENEYSREQS